MKARNIILFVMYLEEEEETLYSICRNTFFVFLFNSRKYNYLAFTGTSRKESINILQKTIWWKLNWGRN